MKKHDIIEDIEFELKYLDQVIKEIKEPIRKGALDHFDVNVLMEIKNRLQSLIDIAEDDLSGFFE